MSETIPGPGGGPNRLFVAAAVLVALLTVVVLIVVWFTASSILSRSMPQVVATQAAPVLPPDIQALVANATEAAKPTPTGTPTPTRVPLDPTVVALVQTIQTLAPAATAAAQAAPATSQVTVNVIGTTTPTSVAVMPNLGATAAVAQAATAAAKPNGCTVELRENDSAPFGWTLIVSGTQYGRMVGLPQQYWKGSGVSLVVVPAGCKAVLGDEIGGGGHNVELAGPVTLDLETLARLMMAWETPPSGHCKLVAPNGCWNDHVVWVEVQTVTPIACTVELRENDSAPFGWTLIVSGTQYGRMVGLPQQYWKGSGVSLVVVPWGCKTILGDEIGGGGHTLTLTEGTYDLETITRALLGWETSPSGHCKIAGPCWNDHVVWVEVVAQ
jgi:hypothetical protein